ncbi:MAG TPA: transaldolase [Chloroflexota bacterium]|nr:transaldolase [Chloroflexota bacterium]
MAANTLQQMFEHGQSPWIDNITRGMLQTGELQRLVDQGIVGLTSNPTIFQKAISGGAEYDEALRSMGRAGKTVEEIYDGLVLEDLGNAVRILRPVYDRTKGGDGFASLEVLPELAHESAKSISEGLRYFGYLNAPNLMIKIPGTAEGVPAIRKLTSEGVNVNVTLLFSLESYQAIATAYIEGLEDLAQAGKPLHNVSSVASFFVSRVDTAVDALLDQKAKDDPARAAEYQALRGKAAIANAKLAYADVYEQLFNGPRWEALAAKGARRQRPMWASTSTKNPAYRDVLYVEELIGPDTVDTMPPGTITDFLDHGRVRDSLQDDVEGARDMLRRLKAAGIDMAEVTRKLQDDGVASFSKSFTDLMTTISGKCQEVLAHAG